MSVYDFAVIGKGLIGSAAGRYLSNDGARTIIIGPDEPTSPHTHRGVFASHYDQGRITRLIGRDPIYSKLAEMAIEKYGELERTSGIRFHYPVGMLVAESPRVPDGHMKDPLGIARALNRRFTLFEAGDRSWKETFSYLDFPDDYRVIHEPGPAGYINPREMIRAQLVCASRRGLSVALETATRVRRRNGVTTIDTDAGNRYHAATAVIAAGAFVNCHDLLSRKLAYETETESILLGRVSDEDGERLANAPTVIYLVDDPEIWDVYMTPPIRYPDGRFYIKLGANSAHDEHPASLEEIGRWFRNGDSDRNKAALARALRFVWPGLEFLSMETRRCILSRTPNGYPVIDEVDDGVVVAAGGNGGSAKSADALGGLAATLARRDAWPEDLPKDLFHARWEAASSSSE